MSNRFDARALEKIDSPDATAAAYFALFRSSDAAPQDYSAFEHWYARDQAHRQAWAKVERAWQKAGEKRDDARILTIRERALANRRRKRSWRMPAAAAALLAVVGGGIGYDRFMSGSAPVTISEGRSVATQVGQQASLRMSDGSIILVNTDSVVSVTESDKLRATTLRRGEALFEVAKNDLKPFIVKANDVSVTAIGTSFAVRALDDAVKVTLLRGKVRVDFPDGRPGTAFLEPGMELTFRHGIATIASIDPVRSLGWRNGMIDFDRTPLASAVAEVNRYNSQTIVIASASLNDIPVTGTFRIGVTRGFIQSLESSGMVRVAKETPSRIELAAP